MMGRLHVDLLLQDRFLLNSVSVKIWLVCSKNAFSLLTGGQNSYYNVQIVDAVLFASKAVLSPTVQMAHTKALVKGTAKYPTRPVDCNVYSIPQGAMSLRNDSSCGASTTTPTTAATLKTHSTPRTTPLTSLPSTDVRFRPNRYSQTSRPAATFEATSTCCPPPVNKYRTKATSCRKMTLANAIPSSASI